MKRPEIKDYFPEKTDLETVHSEYTKSPHLYSYSSALDMYIDYLEEQLETYKSKPEDSKNYQVAFGNNLGAIIKITDNKIQVEKAIDGWGDPIMLSQIEIIEIK